MLDQSILNTGPAIELIDVPTLRQHGRIDLTVDDNLIAIYITAARQSMEKYLSRALITQTWDAFFTAGPGSAYDTLYPKLEMPIWDVQSFVSVSYMAVGFSPAVIDPAYFTAVGNSVVITEYGSSFGLWWPDGATSLDLGSWAYPMRWQVRYVAGYGDTVAQVPGNLVLANLMLATNYYENRQGEPPTVRYRSEAAGFGFPPQVKKILDQYKRWVV